jgi:hypothetical protein
MDVIDALSDFFILSGVRGPWEQQRAPNSAASLLRYRWRRLSAHQRLHSLAAIEGRHKAADRDRSDPPDTLHLNDS